MTQSLFYHEQPNSSLDMSEHHADDNHHSDSKHADHQIIVEKNLCQIMDSVIFNNDFLLKYHEIQNNCNLRVTQKWNIDETVISNYTELIDYMEKNPTCKTYELKRVTEYDQAINVPSFISYLGIPSKLPCRVKELLILYKNKCQLFVDIDILDSYLKDKSKTNLEYTIKQHNDHNMIIYGNVICTFNSNMLMWGLKDKIESYMKSLADVKLGEWFEIAKQFLKNSDTYVSTRKVVETPIVQQEKSDNKNVKIVEPSEHSHNAEQDDEIEDYHSDNTSENSYYSTKSAVQDVNPANLIDHSYNLVKLKNELTQLKATYSQLDLKIKNLESSFKENQLQTLIRKYFNKINLLISQQRDTRYKLKNRVKLISVLWFVLGLFVGPIVYYISRLRSRK